VSTKVAPDGSPVEVYRRLPPAGEAELIDAVVPRGASILELGCGAGRITHALLRLGHRVTAVDESPEMLAHIGGAEVVESTIDDLDLGRTFDCVVLASHFVNAPRAETRRRLLETCARHVTPAGVVLVESYPQGLDWTRGVGETRLRGDVAITLVEAKVEGSRVEAVVEYAVDGHRWRQPFTAQMLGEAELTAALGEAGLSFVRWLDDGRSWSAARPCENRAP
jgi:SAM-dependent methyltransferase